MNDCKEKKADLEETSRGAPGIAVPDQFRDAMPGLGVVIPRLGASSEIWAIRQIDLFSRVNPVVLTWKVENPEEVDGRDMRVVLAGTARKPEDGSSRWLLRVRNAASGNFFGAVGAEKELLTAKLQQAGVSAIYCHFGQTALRMLPIAEKLGIPLIAQFHGLDISSSLNNRWYRWSLKRMIRRFAAIICVGSKQMEKLLELGADPDKVHLIPCGVPTEDFQFVSRGGDSGPITFICVSRMVEWKGVHHCIAAFARIAGKLEGSRLVVVGEGPYLETLRALAEKLGVEGSVEFTGALREDQVRTRLEDADVFLQHSLDHTDGWFEGFGVSVAEAAAIGLPVVVSACGGILDQVVDGETGLVVSQRDEEAMAGAMLRLACDPELRDRFGRAGRDRMERLFNTRDQVRKLEEVIVSQLP